MDIKNPHQELNKKIDRALSGQPFATKDLLGEDKQLIDLAQRIKNSRPGSEPDKNFAANLRKRLLNEHEHLYSQSENKSKLLADNRPDLLPQARRRWAWASLPIALVAVLVVFTSFAAASPGFYEKFVPKPLKNVMENAKIIETGSVEVSSTPLGATVSLNGRFQGETPLLIENIRTGEHKLKIEKEGFVDVEQKIDVTAGETSKQNFALSIALEDEEQETDFEQVEALDSQPVFVAQTDQGNQLWQISADRNIIDVLGSLPAEVDDLQVSALGDIFYLENQTGGGYAFHQIKDNKDETIFAQDQGRVVSWLPVASQGVFYVVENSNSYSLQYIPDGSSRSGIISERSGSVEIIGQTDTGLAFVYTDSSQALYLYNFSTKNIQEIAVPEGASLNYSLWSASPVSSRLILPFAEDKFVIYDLFTQEITEFEVGNYQKLTWWGSDKVLVKIPDGLQLVGPDSGSIESFVRGDIVYFAADNKGENVSVVMADGTFDVYNSSANKIRQVNFSNNDIASLSFVEPWSLQTFDLSSAEDTGEEIDVFGEIVLESASFEDIVVSGDYAFRVSNAPSTSLEVVDISDPNLPIVATLPGIDFYQEIDAVIEGDQIIATGGLITVFDISNPLDPKITHSTDITAQNVAASDQYLFNSSGSNLRVYSQDPQPEFLSEFAMPGDVLDLQYRGRKVYAALGDGGYAVVNVSDISNMQVEFIDNEYFVSSLAFTDNFVYTFAGSPGSQGLVNVYNFENNLVTSISPSFSQGEARGYQDKLYVISPQVAVYESLASGEVSMSKLLPQSENNPVGELDIGNSIIAGLQNSSLTIYSL